MLIQLEPSGIRYTSLRRLCQPHKYGLPALPVARGGRIFPSKSQSWCRSQSQAAPANPAGTPCEPPLRYTPGRDQHKGAGCRQVQCQHTPLSQALRRRLRYTPGAPTAKHHDGSTGRNAPLSIPPQAPDSLRGGLVGGYSRQRAKFSGPLPCCLKPKTPSPRPPRRERGRSEREDQLCKPL